MQNYIIRIIAIQFLIILIYIGLTSLEFVVSREPNPVGTGLQTWFLIFGHLLVTIFVGLYVISTSKDKRLARNKLIVGTLSIIVIITIYLCVSGIIDHWLWTLRKDVIQ